MFKFKPFTLHPINQLCKGRELVCVWEGFWGRSFKHVLRFPWMCKNCKIETTNGGPNAKWSSYNLQNVNRKLTPKFAILPEICLRRSSSIWNFAKKKRLLEEAICFARRSNDWRKKWRIFARTNSVCTFVACKILWYCDQSILFCLNEVLYKSG